jgi:hypothetical protein
LRSGFWRNNRAGHQLGLVGTSIPTLCYKNSRKATTFSFLKMAVPVKIQARYRCGCNHEGCSGLNHYLMQFYSIDLCAHWATGGAAFFGGRNFSLEQGA